MNTTPAPIIEARQKMLSDFLLEESAFVYPYIKWEIKLNDDTVKDQTAFEVIFSNTTNYNRQTQVLFVNDEGVTSILRGDEDFPIQDFGVWLFFDEFVTNPEASQTGVQLIADERWEQIYKHGRNIQDDVEHNTDYQLSAAASALCMYEKLRHNVTAEDVLEFIKDWDKEHFTKMWNKPYRERLIIAGALIAAELDRIDNN